MRLVLALLALLIAIPASAATYRIDVTGQTDRVIMSRTYDPVIGETRSVDYLLTDPGNLLTWRLATTGKATFDGSEYSDCEGLLTPLCFGRPGLESSLYYAFDFSEAGFRYEDDASHSWQISDVSYHSDGMITEGSFSRYAVTEVPLPAGMLLLLSGLIPLYRLRRSGCWKTLAAPD